MLYTRFKEKVDKSDCYIICLIAILQVVIIVVGTIFLLGWQKFAFGNTSENCPEAVFFVSNYGIWFLLIPVCWASVMFLSPLKEETADLIGLFGCLALLGLICFYVTVTFSGIRGVQAVPKEQEKEVNWEPRSVSASDNFNIGFILVNY